jgi:hypothetical protein
MSGKPLVRPHPVVLESGHFSGFDRGVECFKSFADFLDLAQNQSAISWRYGEDRFNFWIRFGNDWET